VELNVGLSRPTNLVEATLAEKGNKLPTKCVTPLSSGYRPEADTGAELGAQGHRYFQELIEMMRWAVDYGRLDILLEVSMLSRKPFGTFGTSASYFWLPKSISTAQHLSGEL
jgi:hypothetical protein